MFDLTGKVAVVTGGNGGLGLGMARGLAAAGARVVVAARNAEKSAAAVAELAKLSPAEPLALAVDVTDQRSVGALVSQTLAHCGRLDILLANAGINIRKPPQDFSLDEWRRILDTNLTSAFLCAQAVHAPMKRGGGGKIITVGSMFSVLGSTFASVYAASKGGLLQLSRSLAVAWAPDNIQVNAILPGWIDTDLTRETRRQIAGLHERVLARTPAGRWGETRDLAGLAVFLASASSDFITGTAIPVDGGYSALG